MILYFKISCTSNPENWLRSDLIIAILKVFAFSFMLVFAATSFSRSKLQSLIPLLELMPDQPFLNLLDMLNLVSGLESVL